VARIRSVKPAYWSDGAIKRLRDPSALFFISLWNFADDAGFFTLDTLELSLKIPRWKPQAIAKMIKSLSDAGLVRVSTKSGVGQVVHWRHQKIDKPRASEWEGKQIQWDAPVDSPNDIEPSPTVRRKDRIGEDRIDMAQILGRIYAAYPRRKGGQRKNAGIAKLSKIVTDEVIAERVFLAVRNYAKHCDAEKKTGTQWVLQFATWVSNWEEWEKPEADASQPNLLPVERDSKGYLTEDAKRKLLEGTL
jgi:hypothetical protein